MFCLKPISLWLTLISPTKMQGNVIILQIIQKLSRDNAYIDHDKVVSDDEFLLLDALRLQQDILNKGLRFF